MRPANIIVEEQGDGIHKIANIFDWELGGFYSAYWESIKLAGCLKPNEESDAGSLKAFHHHVLQSSGF